MAVDPHYNSTRFSLKLTGNWCKQQDIQSASWDNHPRWLVPHLATKYIWRQNYFVSKRRSVPLVNERGKWTAVQAGSVPTRNTLFSPKEDKF